MSTQRRILVFAAAALAIVTLASCSSAKHPASQPIHLSGIFGIVVVNDPLYESSLTQLPDGFGLDAFRPWDADVIVLVKSAVGANAGKVVAIARSGQSALQVSLPPGTYVLTAMGLSSETTKVIVRPGQYTRTVIRLILF